MNGTQAGPKTRRPRRWSRLLVAALFLAVTLIVIRSMAPQTVGETARRQLLLQLQDHYRGYSVSIRRGHFDPTVGLIFEDLRISADSASTWWAHAKEMVRIERMVVIGDLHPEKLLNKQNPLTTRRIVLDGIQANAWLGEDGQISLAELLPLPKLGPAAPRMEMRRVKLRLVDGKSKSRPVDAEFPEAILINTTNAAGGVDKRFTLRGSTDFADEVLIGIDTKGGSTDVRCAIKGAHLGRNLFGRLPAAWAEMTQHAQDLQCVCDVTLAMHRRDKEPWNFRLRTTVHDGQFAHVSLPKPISGLRGVIVCEPGGVSIEASHGTLGDAVVRVTGQVGGYQWPCKAKLNVSTRGLLLDDRLAASLPESMQRSWNRLQPQGRVDVDAEVTHENFKWTTSAEVVCKGVDVRYEKFPYPVENVVGQIEVRDGVASARKLDGRIGGNRMQCAFRMPIQPGVTNEKLFVIASDGSIPIDNTLLNSLSPRGSPRSQLESFVRSLGPPRGSVQLVAARLATDASGKQTRKFDLRVIDGYLRYEKFAYPLYNVAGRIQIEDQLVKLVGFQGTNANAGSVVCNGEYRIPAKVPAATTTGISSGVPSEQEPSRLALRFDVNNVPMDEALRSSLPPSTQHVWDAISPSGVLDELNVIVGQVGSGGPLDLNVTATQRDRQQVTSRTLSLRPSSLPYRIDVTGGRVQYDGSRVTIESIRGKHDASTLSADGRCIKDDSGRWELLLNLHSGSRLRPDMELIAALPNTMREAMRRLQLRGPVSVRGQTRFALPDATHHDTAFEWDLVLQLEGNRIADVGPVHSMRGELSVKGMSDELGLRAIGDVRIDSMNVHDLQITGIRGPFSIDGDRLHMGGQAADRNIRPVSLEQASMKGKLSGLSAAGTVANAYGTDLSLRQAPSIGGKLFDGTIDMDGEVILSSGAFDVGLALENAQVPTLLADFGHTDNELTGTFTGQTRLQGNLGTTDLLKGSGAANVTGANMYKLPLIVQVMNLLRVTPTEDVAFTDGEVEFTIFGDTMTFSDLQIWGDLISLHGGGTLDRRRELDLTFNTRVSPQNSFTQVFRPLRSQRYTLWTIDVRGPLHALQIERRALDGVGETLERLFPGMGGKGTGSGATAAGLFDRWIR